MFHNIAMNELGQHLQPEMRVGFRFTPSSELNAKLTDILYVSSNHRPRYFLTASRIIVLPEICIIAQTYKKS